MDTGGNMLKAMTVWVAIATATVGAVMFGSYGNMGKGSRVEICYIAGDIHVRDSERGKGEIPTDLCAPEPVPADQALRPSNVSVTNVFYRGTFSVKLVSPSDATFKHRVASVTPHWRGHGISYRSAQVLFGTWLV